MDIEIIIENSPFYLRGAVLENNALAELHVLNKASMSILGNIYLGRVKDINKGIESAFVDIGLEKNAFLFIQNNMPVRKGDEILVQIEKDATGDKSPVVSRKISFPGNSLVLFLNQEKKVNISTKITDKEERERLINVLEPVLPENYGLIVRTIAEGKNSEILINELHEIVSNAESALNGYKFKKAPALIHSAPTFWNKLIMDTSPFHIKKIYVNDEEILNSINQQKWISDKSIYKPGAIFYDFGIDNKIEKSLRRRVWLNSGGFIVIDETEAMTVIDVNTGKAKGKKTLSKTAFEINKEAAKEIISQIRIRNLSGIIVVDFIDMEDKELENRLIQILTEEAKRDRKKTVIVGMADLGLALMTRKKTTEPLSKILQENINDVNGGKKDLPSYVALKIYNELVKLTTHTIYDLFTISAIDEVIKVFPKEALWEFEKRNIKIEWERIKQSDCMKNCYEIRYKKASE